MSVRLRLRKFSPIDREYPIFEILDGDDVVLDVSLSDAGNYELGVHESSSSRVLPLREVLGLIEEAQRRLGE
ncbi:MAG: hypothetical protein IT379_22285 [Deltaproteobacteria bacterium]|nr:hypothetical protein [Deltaproteobacteria bacterium]